MHTELEGKIKLSLVWMQFWRYGRLEIEGDEVRKALRKDMYGLAGYIDLYAKCEEWIVRVREGEELERRGKA